MPTGERRRSKRAPNRGLMKPVQRWVPAFSEDRCATHDGRGIGPNGESYPDAHGWDCSGCRWAPPRVAARHGFRKWARERTDDAIFATLTGDTEALERMGLGLITIDAPVDKPADNPEVIHSPLGDIPKALLRHLGVRPFWGDPPETISHGKAVGLVMGPGQLEQLKGDPDWQLADLDARKAITQRAVDYAAKHGVPVNLTCAGEVVETIFPPEVYR